MEVRKEFDMNRVFWGIATVYGVLDCYCTALVIGCVEMENWRCYSSDCRRTSDFIAVSRLLNRARQA